MSLPASASRFRLNRVRVPLHQRKFQLVLLRVMSRRTDRSLEAESCKSAQSMEAEALTKYFKDLADINATLGSHGLLITL